MTRKRYESGKAPAHLATRIQLAEKKLEPTSDPVGVVVTRRGREIDLYDWRDSKHSRYVKADQLKTYNRQPAAE